MQKVTQSPKKQSSIINTLSSAFNSFILIDSFSRSRTKSRSGKEKLQERVKYIEQPIAAHYENQSNQILQFGSKPRTAFSTLTSLTLSLTLYCGLILFSANNALAQNNLPDDDDTQDVQQSDANLENDENTAPPEPIIDWEKKLDAAKRLDALDQGLLGDRIDPHTGALSFEHTDISLPGNSSLEVSVKRRIRSGGLYHSDVKAEFGDWELITPRIKVMTSSLSNYRTGNRCSDTNALQYIDVPYPAPSPSNPNTIITKSKRTYSGDYSNGYFIDTPESGAQQMLKHRSGSPSITANAKYVTMTGWKISCLPNISGGGEGYIATAPNGTIYRFDKFYELRATNLGFLGHTDEAFERYMSFVAATKVTDVHGNTVDYTYDSANRLTRIEANDGRLITLSYTNGTNMVSRVSANGRNWDYTYGVNDLNYRHYEGRSVPIGPYPTLTQVSQPDGNNWLFSLEALSAETPPALTCNADPYTISVTHPYGTKGDFIIQPLKHKVNNTRLSGKPTNADFGYCPAPDPNGFAASGGGMSTQQYYAPVWMMSTTGKVLSSSNIPNMSWGYEYELDAGLWGPNTDQLNRTDVSQPDGTILRYFHGWGTEPVIGNQLTKMQVVEGGSVIKDVDYTHIWEGQFGSDGLSGGFLDFFGDRPRRVTKTVTVQDGDTFTTENTYNTTSNSSSYSFGKPTQTKTYSNVSTNPRTFTFTYEHKIGNWILNLPKKTILNGRELIDYIYDAKGLKTSQSRYGQNGYYTFSYYNDGTPRQIVDALGRISQASQWKRGTPQEIKNALNTSDEVTIKQVVDNNGWITSSEDGNQNVSTYSYDSMGRMTAFNPPAPWASTTISYSFPSAGGAVQTISKAQSKTTVTYDSMLRDTLVRTDDVGGSWTAYTKKQYDASGRNIFTSTPSQNQSASNGILKTYDGLGRIITEKENVTPFAQTTYAYLNQHRKSVTNPLGQTTTRYYDGYNGPDKGALLKILQPLGVNTTLTRNQWGEIEQLTQQGSHSGYAVNKSQTYQYNAQRRLCRHRTAEGGDTLYAYDLAGQMTSYAKGQNTTSCATPSGTNAVSLTYDNLGRVTRTDYASASTPDIAITYDNNGNVLTNKRGGADWTYAYNALKLLTHETLSIDGKTYNFTYQYNPSGHVISSNQPGIAANLTHSVDGLGRLKALSSGSQTFANAFTYFPDSTVKMMTYGNGHQSTYYQNARLLLTRLVTEKSANRVIDLNYSYDALGKITHINNAVNSAQNQSFTYDSLGQLKTADGSWGAGTFKYDSLGNIRQKILGSKTVNMNYDAQNRLSSYTDSTGPNKTLSYDTRGNVIKMDAEAQQQNCLVTKSHNYVKKPGATVWNHTMSVNTCTNQVVSIQSTSDNPNLSPRHDTYTFPAFNAGTSYTVTRPSTVISNGKRYTIYLESTFNTNGALTFRHRIREDGSATYSNWVNHGGLVFPSAPPPSNDNDLNFTYDLADQPRSISGKASGTYAYDGNLKRVKSVINGAIVYNIYNAAGQLALVEQEKTVNGVQTQDRTAYVRANDKTIARVKNGVTTFIHSDHLGSAQVGTDGSGLMTFQEYYTPFGEVINASAENDNQAGFTGHIRDTATGLNYMQARYYDPNIGRFLSIDPVTFMETGEPGYFNRYAYTMNDPVNGFDPNGMWKVTIGASAKASYGPGGRVGASISYDTNGHTLSVKGLMGARVGAAGAISITGGISESGDFAKSDVKLGVALDGEASAGFAKATAEISGEASLRDGFSGDAGVDGAIGAEAIVEGGSIAGGTLEGSLGVDAGITGSAEISISGTEAVNAVKSGANFAAEQVGKIERGLKDKYDGR